MKCQICKKKLTIAMQMKCKCGIYTCSEHKPSIAHNCTWDYKQEHSQELEKKLIGVKTQKVIKI